MTSKNASDQSESSESSSETSLYRVMSADEIDDGERVLITVEGKDIVIFKEGGELYAIANYCLHQEGPMCEGNVLRPSYMESEKTEKDWDLSQNQEVPTIACPWHGWEYNLETGEHVAPTEYTLPTYDIGVRDGDVYIEV